jgi:hypothetical protein
MSIIRSVYYDNLYKIQTIILIKMAEAINSPERESSPFLTIKGQASLYKDNKMVDQLNLEEIEPISN